MLVLLLTALFLLVCLALLSSLCLHCYRRPMASIRQTNSSEDTYIPTSQFLIHRPTQYSLEQNYTHPPPTLLSPPFLVEGTKRPSCPSFTPTETESNNSYENADCVGRDDEAPDPGYVEVLPDTAPLVAIVSRASSLSAGSNNYENTEEDEDEDEDEDEESNYVNVCKPKSQSPHCIPSHDQQEANHSQDSSESSDDDDDEGDYVNQPSKTEPSA